MSEVLSVILTHQPPSGVARLLDWWKPYSAEAHILLAYGGTEVNYHAIDHPQKFFISDPRLRTRDHVRELQSYTNVYQSAAKWLVGRKEFDHVFLAEYDHLPLVRDFSRCMTELLDKEYADALMFDLCRIDRTNYPHYLNAAHRLEFHAFWKRISCRADKHVVLSMLGTGSFWKREAFEVVGNFAEPFPMYHEIYIPTLAHHIGFRLRDIGMQNRFVRASGNMTSHINHARLEGAWSLHPVKGLVNAETVKKLHAQWQPDVASQHHRASVSR